MRSQRVRHDWATFTFKPSEQSKFCRHSTKQDCTKARKPLCFLAKMYSSPFSLNSQLSFYLEKKVLTFLQTPPECTLVDGFCKIDHEGNCFKVLRLQQCIEKRVRACYQEQSQHIFKLKHKFPSVIHSTRIYPEPGLRFILNQAASSRRCCS